MSPITVLCCYKNIQLVHMIGRNYTGVHELEVQPILLQKAVGYKLTDHKHYWKQFSYSMKAYQKVRDIANNTHNMRSHSLWNVFPSE
jgi:hypothetical protein